VDSPPPPPPQEPAPYVYAANDQRPRGAREQELCDKASTTDWLYEGLSLATFAATLYVDTTYFKFFDQPGLRTIGPGLTGLTWGFTLGGAYLAQPKCYGFVQSAPPEGDVRSTLPLAIALGMLSAASAPMIEYYFTGPIPPEWSVSERRFRVFAAAGGGMIGAFLPYLLPPKTWRAAKELRRIRAEGDIAGGTGGFVSYTVRF